MGELGEGDGLGERFLLNTGKREIGWSSASDTGEVTAVATHPVSPLQIAVFFRPLNYRKSGRGKWGTGGQ